jgi:Ca2+-binding EF-hand superfamily protein
MTRWIALPSLLLPSLLLAACSSHSERPDRQHVIVSPNAEPLALGDEARCRTELAAWFARVDTNRDGSIDKAEFMADARRWFAEVDLNHRGYVTAAELAQVRDRKVPLPPPSARPRRERSDEDRPLQPPPRSRFDPFYDRPSVLDARERETRWRETPKSSAAMRGDEAGEPDPFMAADLDLDFKVTRAEWEVYTGNNFDRLDRNNDGRLQLDEVVRTCEPVARRG